MKERPVSLTAGAVEVAPPGARAMLLDTASAIMRDGDVIDISLSELSLRSGLNSALVKYYFGNKAGLLKALLDRDWEAIVVSVNALVAKDGWEPEAKLRRHLWKVVDTFYEVPYLNRLTMRMVRESDDTEARRIAGLDPERELRRRLEGIRPRGRSGDVYARLRSPGR